ncbi:hypothetical protein CAPTEDRAFT_204501 [Capitella teleta]|uniref:Apple domain-containing protein n=1 Tax=Capitella teleta TaxID=283909 RepID=R7TXB9_CAPTE|nr:hypothetical protein CAPTEDRAFT_204501 [Capitella teleta]|eukprot:ELT98344.1 hypothetical protein CAPTEDRAFT_204501 [Capitella teleta]
MGQHLWKEGLIVFIIIVRLIQSQELIGDKFAKIKGKFFQTNYSLTVEIFRSQLQCALLCQRQKCCLSVLIHKEDEGYSCRTLDSYITINNLVLDAKGAYMYKTDPSAQSDFTWSTIIRNKYIYEHNLGIPKNIDDNPDGVKWRGENELTRLKASARIARLNP